MQNTDIGPVRTRGRGRGVSRMSVLVLSVALSHVVVAIRVSVLSVLWTVLQMPCNTRSKTRSWCNLQMPCNSRSDCGMHGLDQSCPGVSHSLLGSKVHRCPSAPVLAQSIASSNRRGNLDPDGQIRIDVFSHFQGVCPGRINLHVDASPQVDIDVWSPMHIDVDSPSQSWSELAQMSIWTSSDRVGFRPESTFDRSRKEPVLVISKSTCMRLSTSTWMSTGRCTSISI